MEIEQKLVEMSRLIQKMTEPVLAALKEIEAERYDRQQQAAFERRSRKTLLWVFAAMVFVNVGFGIYNLNEMHSVVERIQQLQVVQAEHRIDSGLTEAQVQALVTIGQRSATSPQQKEDLKKVEMMKPAPNTIQAAATAAVLEGLPPKQVAERIIGTAVTVDAGAEDSGIRIQTKRP